MVDPRRFLEPPARWASKYRHTVLLQAPDRHIAPMRRVTLFAAVALLAYTALAIALYQTVPFLVIVHVGDNGLLPFDFVFWLCAFLLIRAFLRRQAILATPLLRYVTYIVLFYLAYQVLVVAPVAVIKGTYPPIGALYAVTQRFTAVLVLFFALLLPRYWNPRIVFRLIEIAAVILLIVALWRLSTGTRVDYDVATGRFRALWGGGTLLFGWVLVVRLLRPRLRPQDLLFSLLALAGIVLINHRSAYIAIAMSFICYLLTRRRHTIRTVGTVLLVCIIAGLLIVSLVPSLYSGLRYSFGTVLNPYADTNASDRITRVGLGLQTFTAYPLGDVFWRAPNMYYIVDLGDSYFEPHNFAAQLLVKEGVVGTLVWFALLALCLSASFRNARRDQMSAVLGAYLVFYLTFCFFNANFYMTNNVMFLTAPMGLILWRDALLLRKQSAVRQQQASVRYPLVSMAETGTSFPPTSAFRSREVGLEAEFRDSVHSS